MDNLSSLSTLSELIATLSIGFVAVEYVKSYTSVLCEKIFRHVEFINQSYDECRKKLVDKDTLDHIEPLQIKGKSTFETVEKVKRDHESLRKEIDQEEEQKIKEILDASQSKSLSSICFYIFLSNVILLWAESLESCYQQEVHIFTFLFCVLSSLYLLFAWFLGEKENNCWYVKFSSLKHASVSLAVSVVIAMLLLIIAKTLLDTTIVCPNILYAAFYTLLIYTAASYFNFIVFAWKINNKANRFKEKVTEAQKCMMQKCTEKKQEAQDLIAVARVASNMQTCNTHTTSTAIAKHQPRPKKRYNKH